MNSLAVWPGLMASAPITLSVISTFSGDDLSMAVEQQRIRATYELQSKNVADAAHALAFGQSMGNPYVRNARETPELFEKHGATVDSIDGNIVVVSWPAINFGPEDGVAFLMSVLMGGQMD